MNFSFLGTAVNHNRPRSIIAQFPLNRGAPGFWLTDGPTANVVTHRPRSFQNSSALIALPDTKRSTRRLLRVLLWDRTRGNKERRRWPHREESELSSAPRCWPGASRSLDSERGQGSPVWGHSLAHGPHERRRRDSALYSLRSYEEWRNEWLRRTGLVI